LKSGNLHRRLSEPPVRRGKLPPRLTSSGVRSPVRGSCRCRSWPRRRAGRLKKGGQHRLPPFRGKIQV
jgi:hypothetical protein